MDEACDWASAEGLDHCRSVVAVDLGRTQPGEGADNGAEDTAHQRASGGKDSGAGLVEAKSPSTAGAGL